MSTLLQLFVPVLMRFGGGKGVCYLEILGRVQGPMVMPKRFLWE